MSKAMQRCVSQKEDIGGPGNPTLKTPIGGIVASCLLTPKKVMFEPLREELYGTRSKPQTLNASKPQTTLSLDLKTNRVL